MHFGLAGSSLRSGCCGSLPTAGTSNSLNGPGSIAKTEASCRAHHRRFCWVTWPPSTAHPTAWPLTTGATRRSDLLVVAASDLRRQLRHGASGAVPARPCLPQIPHHRRPAPAPIRVERGDRGGWTVAPLPRGDETDLLEESRAALPGYWARPSPLAEPESCLDPEGAAGPFLHVVVAPAALPGQPSPRRGVCQH
jgi:hypothetical protein